MFLTCGVLYNRGEQRPKALPCKYLQWIHTGLYPLPSEPVPEWLMKFTASRQPQRYKPRPLKSVNKSNPDQQKVRLVSPSSAECKPVEPRPRQQNLDEEQKRQAKPKGLPRTLA